MFFVATDYHDHNDKLVPRLGSDGTMTGSYVSFQNFLRFKEKHMRLHGIHDSDRWLMFKLEAYADKDSYMQHQKPTNTRYFMRSGYGIYQTSAAPFNRTEQEQAR